MGEAWGNVGEVGVVRIISGCGRGVHIGCMGTVKGGCEGLRGLSLCGCTRSVKSTEKCALC